MEVTTPRWFERANPFFILALIRRKTTAQPSAATNKIYPQIAQTDTDNSLSSFFICVICAICG